MNGFLTVVSEWSSIILVVFGGFWAWSRWSMKKTFVRTNEFDAYKKEQAAKEAEVTAKHGADVHVILLAIQEIKGSQNTMQAKMDGQEKILLRVEERGNRMETYLLNRE